MAKRKPCVFLSHSSHDAWIAERLQEKSEEIKGVTTWLDAFDLPGGRNVKQRIKEGIESSTECLILLSPACEKSDWVKHEAGLADGFDLPTVLVLLHVDESDVPEPLRDLRFFDINEFPAYEKHIAMLAKMASRSKR
jgi:hypothetical protein